MKQDEPKRYGSEEEENTHEEANLQVSGPLALWVGIFALAGIIQLFIFPNIHVVSPAASYLNMAASYALYTPGTFILPILAALWIGGRAGSTEGKLSVISYRAAINAVYASVIYLVVAFVFYIVATHISSVPAGVLSTMSFPVFIEYVIAIPIVICLVVAPLFAIISAAKRY